MPMEHLKPTNADSALVIALHCSGAGAGQWRQLGETLGRTYTLLAPEHYGCERTGPWTGTHASRNLATESSKMTMSSSLRKSARSKTGIAVLPERELPLVHSGDRIAEG